MTVSSTTSRSGPYTGNGVTTVFAYGFRILDETHVEVVRTESGVDETVSPSEFTVSGVGDAVGGNITFTLAPTVDQTITIIRAAPFTQQVDLENQGAYYAETIEEAFDLAAMRDQQLQEQVDRSVKIPVGADASTLGGLIEDVILLADNVAAVDTVATNIGAVTTVAGLTDEIAALPGQVTDAQTAATAAETALDEFDDRYLGAKAAAPTLDNDGNALLVGAVYWDTVSDQMFTWSGTEWLPTFLTGNTVRSVVTATAAQTVFTTPTYLVGANTLSVFVNGLKVLLTEDYVETDQNTITFSAGLTAGDEVELIAVQTIAVGESDAANVTFTQAGTGAVERTVQQKLGEVVSVKDFGAVGDGVADDTAAILAAVAAHDVVYFPQGTYLTTATIELDRAGQALKGYGRRRTEIRIASTTLSAITLASGVADYTIHGLKIGRTGTPVLGADGIKFLGTTDNSEITDVTCEGHYDGLVIGTCDTGLLREVRCRANLRDGISQTNSVSYGPSQWEAQDILVDRNVRDGWRIASTAGPAGLILGTMNSVKSFANSERGIHLIGNATTPIFDLRLVNAFLGSDGFGSIRLDTYGGKHRINGFFERNGRDATGPAVSTSATGTAPGIEISPNNVDVTVYGSTIDDNSYDGIQHEGGILIVSACNIFNNGQSLTAGRRNGILSNAGRLVVGAGVLTNLGGNTTQLYGIGTAHDDLVVVGNDMAGNATGGATIAGGTTNATLVANTPSTMLGFMPGTIDIMYFGQGLTPGATGGLTGPGTINVAGGLLKNNVAYSNP